MGIVSEGYFKKHRKSSNINDGIEVADIRNEEDSRTIMDKLNMYIIETGVTLLRCIIDSESQSSAHLVDSDNKLIDIDYNKELGVWE